MVFFLTSNYSIKSPSPSHLHFDSWNKSTWCVLVTPPCGSWVVILQRKAFGNERKKPRWWGINSIELTCTHCHKIPLRKWITPTHPLYSLHVIQTSLHWTDFGHTIQLTPLIWNSFTCFVLFFSRRIFSRPYCCWFRSKPCYLKYILYVLCSKPKKINKRIEKSGSIA